MGYEWADWVLRSLRDIEDYEVVEALSAGRRWPRLATDGALDVLTIWARTAAGRPLIVVVRQTGTWDWQILGARDIRASEVAEFECWEAGRD